MVGGVGWWKQITEAIDAVQFMLPFMAPDIPEGFVERPKEFDELIHKVLDTENENPVAITTALQGAGGESCTRLITTRRFDLRPPKRRPCWSTR
jgi:hypothetical protein